jgi:hypothetical protein
MDVAGVLVCSARVEWVPLPDTAPQTASSTECALTILLTGEPG